MQSGTGVISLSFTFIAIWDLNALLAFLSSFFFLDFVLGTNLDTRSMWSKVRSPYISLRSYEMEWNLSKRCVVEGTW